jgi:membrane protease YdiL (CAAX protease family)
LNSFAPKSLFSPSTARRIGQTRLIIDVCGVTLVRVFQPLVHDTAINTVLNVYSVAAWFTILTVDSTRIPEASSTRHMQRQSWLSAMLLGPVFIIVSCIIMVPYGHKIFPLPLTVGEAGMGVIRSYMDELLFRNTLQAKLRQWGMSKWGAIGMQSAIYATAVGIQHRSLPIVLSFALLGWINGLIVHKFRSLWPPFVLGTLWNFLWLE